MNMNNYLLESVDSLALEHEQEKIIKDNKPKIVRKPKT